MTIDEEADLFIPSSVVIPRLLSAKRRVETLISKARDGDRSDGAIIGVQVVGGWRRPFADLWDTCLD